MKRSGPLKRKTPMRRSTKRWERTAKQDAHAEFMRWATPLVYERDQGCVLVERVPGHRCDGPLGPPHHVWPRGHGGPDTLANLIGCCVGGHDWIHFVDPQAATQAGLLVRRPTDRQREILSAGD